MATKKTKKTPSPPRKPTSRAREDAGRTARGKTILVSHVRVTGGDGTTRHVPPADTWVGEDGERIALAARVEDPQGKPTAARGSTGRDESNSPHDLGHLRHDARQVLVAADKLMTELGEREASAVLQALIVAVSDDDATWRAQAQAIVKEMSDMVDHVGRGPSRGAPKKPETRMFERLESYVRASREAGGLDNRALAIAVAHGLLDLRGVPLATRRETISLVEGQADRLAHADAGKFVRNVARVLGWKRADNLTNAKTQARSRAIRKKRRSASRPHS